MIDIKIGKEFQELLAPLHRNEKWNIRTENILGNKEDETSSNETSQCFFQRQPDSQALHIHDTLLTPCLLQQQCP